MNLYFWKKILNYLLFVFFILSFIIILKENCLLLRLFIVIIKNIMIFFMVCLYVF